MSNRNLFLAAGGAPSGPVDPNFNQTTLLLHGDGTNGAQNNTFLDSSTNNFTITRNGNTTQGTFSPFSVAAGQFSNFFDGSGDYFTTPYSTTNFDWFTSGTDFTFEAWIYPTTFTGWSYNAGAGDFGTLIGNVTPASSTNYWSFGPIPGGTVRFFYFNGGTVTVTSTEACVLNQWNHIAFTKTSSGITIFVNGVGTTASAISGTPQSSTGVTLTIGSGNGSSINGYVSNLRIVKGTAVYSGTTYTVPTSPLTAIANTKLLTSQSNRFVDNSSVANVLTIVGNTSVQPFSPFAPSAAYSTSVNGGSGYFDGNGDNLTVPNGSDFTFSGAFSVEGWIYPTNLATGCTFLETRTAATLTNYFFWVNNSAPYTPSFLTAGGVILTSSVVPIQGQWNHIAWSSDGSTIRVYVNGVSGGTAAQGSLTTGAAATVGIGGTPLSATVYALTGYMSDLRVVNGTDTYPSAFTPPTAPLTAVTNTKLLLNFTNAGIFDNTGKNNLETVGNAQIDTSVKKYGTGSMEFDGTGDRLTAPTSENTKFGTGDYTIEFWCYPKNNFGCFIDTRSANPSTGGISVFHNGTQLELYASGGLLTVASAFTLDVWQHFALTRSGTNLKAFVNGTQVGTTVTNSNNHIDGRLLIGDNVELAYPYDGYIDDLRITKGVARYTAAFTPPTAAFPDL